MIHELLDARLWSIAGWTMLHAVWVGLLIGAASAVVRRCVQPASANVRYAIAVACFAILAASPLPIALYVYRTHSPAEFEPLTSETPAADLTDSAEPAALPHIAPGARSSEKSAGDAAPMVTNLISSSSQRAPIVSEPTDIGTHSPAITPPVADDPRDASRPLVGAVLNGLVPQLPWLWLIGAPTTLLFLATGLLGAERLRRQSRPVEDAKTLELLRRLAAALHVRARVAIGICDRIAGPILVGIVRPMILLPPAALLLWSPDQLEMVLLHELSHIRRRDNLVNLLQRLVEALMFFVPAVWFVSAWVRLEREHCCDRSVVANTGKAREYAQTLVQLVVRRRSAVAADCSLSKLVTSPMAEHQVLARVRQILKNEDESMKISRMLFGSVLTLFVATAAFVGWYGAALSAGQEQAEQSSAGQDASIRIAESEKAKTAEPPEFEPKTAQTEASGQNIQPLDWSSVAFRVSTKLESPPAEWLQQWQQQTAQFRLLSKVQKNDDDTPRISKVQKADDDTQRKYLFTLRFLDDVTLSSDRAGVLDSIKVQPGDSVKAKDELASFNRDGVEQAELDLKIAALTRDAAAEEHERLLAAYKSGTISGKELPSKKLALDVAQLNLRLQDVKLARLSKPLMSPLTGIVADVFKQSGETVKPGDPILRIVNPDRLIVEGTIDILQTAVPKRGQAFRFTVDRHWIPGSKEPQVFEGKIDFVSAQLDENSTRLKVRGSIDNRDGLLRAGMKGLLQFIDEKGQPIDDDSKKADDSKNAKDDDALGWFHVMFGANITNELSRDGAKSAELQDNQTPKLFERTPFRGGLELDFVDPNGPAGKAGIRDGDILVGLGKWETSTFANAIYVLRDAKINPKEPLKFYVLRKGQVLFGHLNFDQDYVDKESWHRWLDTRGIRRSSDRK
ncbi:MAG: M56 family metallopeptidase [Planctomycetaceae bacterium]